MERTDSNSKNIYAIRQELSNLKRLDFNLGHIHFEYECRRFLVRIFVNTDYIIDKNSSGERLTHYSMAENVLLDEWDPRAYQDVEGNLTGGYVRINLDRDSRFKDYEPIKYSGWNGNKMPIIKICELIKYLHRLNNLEIFS